MKEVILKIHECEAYQELKFANQNSSFLENCKMQVFHDAQITKEQFEKSMAYYRKNPKKLEDIYDSLLLKYN